MPRGIGRWITALLALTLVAALLALAGCNGGDDGDDAGGETPTGETPAADGLAEQPESPQAVEDQVTEASGGVVETEMIDNAFTRNNLKVPLGETTTIQAENSGTAVHNLRIAGPDGQWNTDDDVVSDPDAVAGGEAGEVEFSPTVAGTYTFRCDFHPLEQGGVIVVE